MTDLENLLFKRLFGKFSLFQRPTDIAKAIVSTKGNHFYAVDDTEKYDKNFKNLKVYVSQVIKGQRAASKDLKYSFNVVIQERLHELGEEEIQTVLQDFESAVNENSHKVFVPNDNKWEINELNEMIKYQNNQITYTTMPLETFNNEKSRVYFDKVLSNLGFAVKSADLNDSTFEARYEYHFPSEGLAYLFYKALSERVSTRRYGFTTQEVIERFKLLNQKHLKVYVVNREFCVFRQIVFNYDSGSTGNAAGFIVFTHGESFSVAKMSKTGLQRWIEDVYSHTFRTRIEIPFSQYAQLNKL